MNGWIDGQVGRYIVGQIEPTMRKGWNIDPNVLKMQDNRPYPRQPWYTKCAITNMTGALVNQNIPAQWPLRNFHSSEWDTSSGKYTDFVILYKSYKLNRASYFI